jgi:predicted small lipoprotein YifL
MNANKLQVNANQLSKRGEQSGPTATTKNLVRIMCAALLCAGMAACEKKGPAERAGEKIDNTTKDIGNAVEDKCEEAKESAGASDTRC